MQQEDKEDSLCIEGDTRIKMATLSTPKLVPSMEEIEPCTPIRLSKLVSNKEFTQHKIEQLLRLIFEHFCKRSYENKPNTFDHIKHQTMVLSLNKFMIFSREFGFVANKMITMIHLVTIFRKCSTNFKEMDFRQFKNSLEQIADHAFKKEGETERYKCLLEFMKLRNQQEFKEQMKRIKISIPETLIAPRHGNHFRIYPHCGKFEGDIKKELELRKERKVKTVKSIERKKVSLSPPSAASTKYSQIYANKTRNKFQLNNIVLLAKQQTQYSTMSRHRDYSSTKNQGVTHLQNLIEQEQQDQILDQLYRRERGIRSQYSNTIQDRITKLQRQEGRRIATQNLIRHP